MILEDGTILVEDDITFDDSFLLHKQPYNAAKAHEYYLRTRQLKGRKKGQAQQTAAQRAKAKAAAEAKRKKAVQAEVTKLKARLERLQEELRKLVAAAKARSGVKETPTETASRNESSKSNKPLTAKQKAAKAKSAKENYEKNKKKQSPDDELKEVRAEIKAIREKIKKALEDAKKKNANKSKSKTASKGR